MSKTKKLTRARGEGQRLQAQIAEMQQVVAKSKQEVDILREEYNSRYSAVANVDYAMGLLAHYLLRAMTEGHKASVLHTLMRMARPSGCPMIYQKFQEGDLDISMDYRARLARRSRAAPIGPADVTGGFSSLPLSEVKALALELTRDAGLFDGSKGMVFEGTIGGRSSPRQYCLVMNEEAIRNVPIDMVMTTLLPQIAEEVLNNLLRPV